MNIKITKTRILQLLSVLSLVIVAIGYQNFSLSQESGGYTTQTTTSKYATSSVQQTPPPLPVMALKDGASLKVTTGDGAQAILKGSHVAIKIVQEGDGTNKDKYEVRVVVNGKEENRIYTVDKQAAVDNLNITDAQKKALATQNPPIHLVAQSANAAANSTGAPATDKITSHVDPGSQSGILWSDQNNPAGLYYDPGSQIGNALSSIGTANDELAADDDNEVCRDTSYKNSTYFGDETGHNINRYDGPDPMNDIASSTDSLAVVGECGLADCNKYPSNTRDIKRHNACGGKVTLTQCEKYGGDRCTEIGQCNSNMVMDTNFAKALATNGLECAKEAAKISKFPEFEGIGDTEFNETLKMDIVHSGCYNHRCKMNAPEPCGPGQWSEHAMGTSLDIRSFRLRVGDKQRTVETHKSLQTKESLKFYNAFQSCWAKIGGSDCACSIGHGYSGSAKVANAHADHMHLTYRCGKRGC